ncbi:hypothetical protein B0H13DRAFT_2343958 [Mycena leptocephala]|nr:hypothetical protein B0H13DRAFT_2343958 [Mycena leptocephala]
MKDRVFQNEFVPWGHSSTPALTRHSPHTHAAPASPLEPLPQAPAHPPCSRGWTVSALHALLAYYGQHSALLSRADAPAEAQVEPNCPTDLAAPQDARHLLRAHSLLDPCCTATLPPLPPRSTRSPPHPTLTSAHGLCVETSTTTLAVLVEHVEPRLLLLADDALADEGDGDADADALSEKERVSTTLHERAWTQRRWGCCVDARVLGLMEVEVEVEIERGAHAHAHTPIPPTPSHLPRSGTAHMRISPFLPMRPSRRPSPGDIPLPPLPCMPRVCLPLAAHSLSARRRSAFALSAPLPRSGQPHHLLPWLTEDAAFAPFAPLSGTYLSRSSLGLKTMHTCRVRLPLAAHAYISPSSRRRSAFALFVPVVALPCFARDSRTSSLLMPHDDAAFAAFASPARTLARASPPSSRRRSAFTLSVPPRASRGDIPLPSLPHDSRRRAVRLPSPPSPPSLGKPHLPSHASR